MINALLEAFASALSIWNNIESRKYLDRLMSLKKEWYVESNKDPSIRSDAILDRIEFDISVLGIAFSAGVKSENASVKPE